MESLMIFVFGSNLAGRHGKGAALCARNSHGAGELSAAGMCYAGHACLTLRGKGGDTVPSPWPWADEWWKPKNPRRDLVRAAALLLAEIERLDREALKTPNV